MRGSSSFPKVTIGLDLGDEVSRTCEVDRRGKVVRRDAVATNREALAAYFGVRSRCRRTWK